MKRLATSVAVALLFISQVAFAANAALKIGVIDLPHILQKAPQVAAINKKLHDEFTPQQQKIAAAQEKLRTEAQKLSPENNSKLTQADRKKIQDKIVAGQKQLQEMVVNFQQKISSVQRQAMENFMNEVDGKVKTIAKKDDLDLVLLKPALVYSATKPVDITDQVLKALK